MTVIDPPAERRCQRCGREEVWDDGAVKWVEAPDADDSGWPHCLHEWDINGTYRPVPR
jgi:hypothetical protein